MCEIIVKGHFLIRLSAILLCIVLNSLSNSLFWSGGFCGGGEEFLASFNFFYLSAKAAAPKTLRPDLKFLVDWPPVGEFSPVNPRLGSASRPGVTEVRKARVDLMPSLRPSFVLIDIEEGSFRRPPLYIVCDIMP